MFKAFFGKFSLGRREFLKQYTELLSKVVLFTILQLQNIAHFEAKNSYIDVYILLFIIGIINILTSLQFLCSIP